MKNPFSPGKTSAIQDGRDRFAHGSNPEALARKQGSTHGLVAPGKVIGQDGLLVGRKAKVQTQPLSPLQVPGSAAHGPEEQLHVRPRSQRLLL